MLTISYKTREINANFLLNVKQISKHKKNHLIGFDPEGMLKSSFV